MKYKINQSIFKAKFAKKEIPILPFFGIQTLVVSLAILLGGLFLLDKVFLSSLENRNLIVSQDWREENQRIDTNNYKKNLADGFVPAVKDPYWRVNGNWIWRSKGFPVNEKATRSKRILVMGDSFVWGSGHANMNEIWWRQLQRELIRRGYNQVEVIAAGHNGASTREQLKAAHQLVPEYKPNLIIWGYVTNDPDEGLVKQFNNYELANRDPAVSLLDQLREQNIFSRLSMQLRTVRYQKVAQILGSNETGYEYAGWELKILEGKNFELYKKTVNDLAIFQDSIGIPGFVVTLPNSPDSEYFSPRYAKVKPLFKASGIAFYNILDDFVAKYPDKKLDNKHLGWSSIFGGNNLRWGINPANGHPGTASTYFHAIKVADILEREYPEILGKKELATQPSAIRINDWVPYNLDPVLKSEGVLTFKYPASEEYMLRMPIGKPYVQLNLEFPAAIREIRLTGSGLEKATLYTTAVNPKLQYDDGTLHSLGEQQGKLLVWNLAAHQFAESINTIRLSANFKTANRELTLTIVPAEEVK